VRNDFVPELSQKLADPLEHGQLVINLRAEAAPELLKETIEQGLADCLKSINGLKLELQHQEYFRPGKPQPTHRLETLSQ
jgi:hypothetical protein